MPARRLTASRTDSYQRYLTKKSYTNVEAYAQNGERQMKTGREVSCRAFAPTNAILEANGVDLREFFSKLPVSLEHAGKTHESVSWDEFVAYLHQLGETLGHEALANCAPRTDKLPGNEILSSLSGYFAQARSVYWMLAKTMWIFFRHVEVRFEALSSSSLRITIRIPDEYQDSEDFFRVWVNGFRSAPAVLGMPHSKVHLELKPRMGIYTIFHPPSRTLWSRGRALFLSLFAARTTINELSKQNQEIQKYYEQLLLTRETIQEQKTKLELSAQLTSISSLAALGEMAGAIAHEINNPLMILYLKSGLLKRRISALNADPEKSEQALEDVDSLYEIAQRISGITRGLLAFAGESHEEKLETIPLHRITTQAMQLCSQKFLNAGIQVRQELIPDAALVRARPMQLTHALLNLLTNAFDAVKKEPERWIRIGFRDLGGFLELSVTDSGRGIPTENRDRIFEPFFTTKKLGEGPGLGLSVAKGLIESHHGTIRFDETAENTCFVIRLPGVEAGD
jgi:signal transduction histidine kinase